MAEGCDENIVAQFMATRMPEGKGEGEGEGEREKEGEGEREGNTPRTHPNDLISSATLSQPTVIMQ